ncbi:hypothetical protein MNEG_1605, partial [Monoraphidium neglectum]
PVCKQRGRQRQLRRSGAAAPARVVVAAAAERQLRRSPGEHVRNGRPGRGRRRRRVAAGGRKPDRRAWWRRGAEGEPGAAAGPRAVKLGQQPAGRRRAERAHVTKR